MDMETHIVNLFFILFGIGFIDMGIWLSLKYSHEAFFVIPMMIPVIFLGVILVFIGIDDYIIALKERMKKCRR